MVNKGKKKSRRISRRTRVKSSTKKRVERRRSRRVKISTKKRVDRRRSRRVKRSTKKRVDRRRSRRIYGGGKRKVGAPVVPVSATARTRGASTDRQLVRRTRRTVQEGDGRSGAEAEAGAVFNPLPWAVSGPAKKPRQRSITASAAPGDGGVDNERDREADRQTGRQTDGQARQAGRQAGRQARQAGTAGRQARQAGEEDEVNEEGNARGKERQKVTEVLTVATATPAELVTAQVSAASGTASGTAMDQEDAREPLQIEEDAREPLRIKIRNMIKKICAFTSKFYQAIIRLRNYGEHKDLRDNLLGNFFRIKIKISNLASVKEDIQDDGGGGGGGGGSDQTMQDFIDSQNNFDIMDDGDEVDDKENILSEEFSNIREKIKVICSSIGLMTLMKLEQLSQELNFPTSEVNNFTDATKKAEEAMERVAEAEAEVEQRHKQEEAEAGAAVAEAMEEGDSSDGGGGASGLSDGEVAASEAKAMEEVAAEGDSSDGGGGASGLSDGEPAFTSSTSSGSSGSRRILRMSSLGMDLSKDVGLDWSSALEIVMEKTDLGVGVTVDPEKAKEGLDKFWEYAPHKAITFLEERNVVVPSTAAAAAAVAAITFLEEREDERWELVEDALEFFGDEEYEYEGDYFHDHSISDDKILAYNAVVYAEQFLDSTDESNLVETIAEITLIMKKAKFNPVEQESEEGLADAKAAHEALEWSPHEQLEKLGKIVKVMRDERLTAMEAAASLGGFSDGGGSEMQMGDGGGR